MGFIVVESKTSRRNTNVKASALLENKIFIQSAEGPSGPPLSPSCRTPQIYSRSSSRSRFGTKRCSSFRLYSLTLNLLPGKSATIPLYRPMVRPVLPHECRLYSPLSRSALDSRLLADSPDGNRGDLDEKDVWKFAALPLEQISFHCISCLSNYLRDTRNDE